MGKTLYLLGEASENENNGTTGAFLGDQSGYELRARRWYTPTNADWGKVFRFNDPAIAEEIASRMEKAILNGYIGYDTYWRGTYYDQLLANGFDISAVREDCGTDCSALAYTAIFAATNVQYDGSKAQYPTVVPTNTKRQPLVRQYDHYIERQCVDAGFDVTVFTMETSSDTFIKDVPFVTFTDGTIRYYPTPQYDTPYDVYDAGVDSANVRDHLHVVYLNKENEYGYDESFLNSLLIVKASADDPAESALKRGDIIRTVGGLTRSDGSAIGHVAVWL